MHEYMGTSMSTCVHFSKNIHFPINFSLFFLNIIQDVFQGLMSSGLVDLPSYVSAKLVWGVFWIINHGPGSALMFSRLGICGSGWQTKYKLTFS